jgi:hypothetical protein
MHDVHTVEPASGEGAGAGARLSPYLPILTWARTYQRGWWGRDAIAGLTLWGLLVPKGMAYAGIADLPPEAGRYTLVVSLAIYALMGTSRHLSVGPTSATAALLASSVSAAVLATAADAGDPASYVTNAAGFVLVTGLVFLGAGMLRLGFVTQFLSKPVMDGFVMGLVDVHTPALAFARCVAVLDVIHEDHVFPTIELSVQHLESRHIEPGRHP